MNIDCKSPSLPATGILGSRLRGFALAGVLAVLGACGGVPPPTGQLGRAHSAIDQAASAGADEGAPAELATARDKYTRAEQAAQSGKNQEARWLAEESEADAQVAISQSQVSKSREALAALKETTRALRDEMERAQSSGAQSK